MAMDHSNCTHPRTPAGRRACRASKAAIPELIVRGELANDDVYTGDTPEARKARHDRMDRLQAKLDGAATVGQPYVEWPEGMSQSDYRKLVRRRGREYDARIQPRRSGARVSTTGSTCVQAALHIDAHGGRCACGWVAA